jgi:hypothetical protein
LRERFEPVDESAAFIEIVLLRRAVLGQIIMARRPYIQPRCRTPSRSSLGF